jgi:hypothetical protein
MAEKSIERTKSLLEKSNNVSSTSIITKDSMISRLPSSYNDLQKKFIVRLKIPIKNHPNVAVGEIIVSKIPQGRYKIYYLRPKDR